MKKILSLIMLCLFLTIFSHITLAKSRAVYYTSDPIYVTTRMGTITILFFNVEIESTICGNSNFFKIDKDGKLDKLVITPQKPGTWTNLVVVTKDNLKYTNKNFGYISDPYTHDKDKDYYMISDYEKFCG